MKPVPAKRVFGSSPSRRTRTVRALAVLAAFGLAAAACGGDDDSTATPPPPATDATDDDAVDAGAEDDTDTDDDTDSDDAGASDDGVEPVGGSGGGSAGPEVFQSLCPADEAPDSVTIAIWGSHPDIIGEQMDLFTEVTGVEVVWHVDGTADRLVKLNAERGSPTLDVAILPVNEIGTLFDNGVIMPADPRVPNSDVLVEAATGIDGGWGTSQIQFAIGYNPDLVDEPPTSWLDLLDPEMAPHIGFPNVPGSAGYAILSMIAKELGGSEADLDPAIDAVAEVADDLLAYIDQAAAALQQMETGEMWMYGGIAGSMTQYQTEGGNIEITIPESGGPVGLNVGVIPMGVAHEGCAMAALGWYLGPEVQTEYADAYFYTPVNSAIDLDPEVAARTYPLDEASVVTLDWQAIQDNAEATMDRWMRVIAG